MAELLVLEIDWAEAFEWVCPFCGGDIDHLDDDEQGDGIVHSSYTSQDNGGPMCERAYLVLSFDRNRRGDNGDALTLKRWIEIEIDGRYVNKAGNEG